MTPRTPPFPTPNSLPVLAASTPPPSRSPRPHGTQRVSRHSRPLTLLGGTLASLSLTGLSLVVAGPAGAAPVHAALRHSAPLPSPASLISKVKSAIATVNSVHLVIYATEASPKLTETITQDAGITMGSQHVTSGNEWASVLLTKSDAYLAGNSSGLSAFFALPADDQLLVGTKWILIKSGTTQYQSFVNSVTVKGLLKNLLPTSSALTVHDTTFNKIPTYEIDWSVTANNATTKLTLTVPRTGKELPYLESATSSGTTERSVLSHWNRPVTIHSPANTIAITKLHST